MRAILSLALAVLTGLPATAQTGQEGADPVAAELPAPAASEASPGTADPDAAAAVAEPEAPDADEPLTPVERWQADPHVIFSAAEVTLDDFLWIARPVVVFADTPADPRFQRQMELLTGRQDDLVERDVVIITDTDPAAQTALRKRLRPRGFMLALIAKDGTVVLRKPFPWDVRELSRSIDKQPLRQQEIRERRGLRD